jgi:hypothetical protein
MYMYPMSVGRAYYHTAQYTEPAALGGGGMKEGSNYEDDFNIPL